MLWFRKGLGVENLEEPFDGLIGPRDDAGAEERAEVAQCDALPFPRRAQYSNDTKNRRSTNEASTAAHPRI